jgi:hypothetical protein
VGRIAIEAREEMKLLYDGDLTNPINTEKVLSLLRREPAFRRHKFYTEIYEAQHNAIHLKRWVMEDGFRRELPDSSGGLDIDHKATSLAWDGCRTLQSLKNVLIECVSKGNGAHR